MDLQTFIAESLRQIVGGVADAQRTIADLGTNAMVNPAMVADTARRKSGAASPVEFDIAVTVAQDSATMTQSSSETIGSISVVGSLGNLDDETLESIRSREAFSRIRFTVQLAQPSDVETYSTEIHTMSRGDRYSGY